MTVEPDLAQQLSTLLERMEQDMKEACDAMQQAATANQRLKLELEEMRFEKLKLLEEVARLKKELQQIGAFGFLPGKVARA
jgi:uncharacterized tellurite resistance protein B-like protein